MNTDLVLDAINQAIFARRREGVKDLSGLIHHNDYAEVRVKPRTHDMACTDRVPQRVPRLNVSVFGG
jgi:hypothetical protein